MANFIKAHGIKIANNGFIENAHFERLAADPMPVAAGRVWFNTTEKLFKFSTLDGTGAVIVRAFATHEDLQAAIASISAIDARLTVVEGSYVNKDGSVAFTGNVDAGGNKVVNVANATTASDAVNKGQLDSAIAALGSVFEYAGSLDATTQANLDLLTKKEAGDTYRVTVGGTFTYAAGANSLVVNSGDLITFNATGTPEKIDSTNSEVAGTPTFVSVTGSTDTGFVVDLDAAFKTRMTDAEAAIVQEVADRTAADTALQGAIDAEVTRATAAETLIANNLATEVTDRTAADAAIQAELDATQTGAGLAGNGAYVPNATANYTSTATSLMDAANKLDTALKAEETARTTADSALDTRVTAVEEQVNGKIGDLTSLLTTDKTNLVAAINEIQTEIGHTVENNLADLHTEVKTNIVNAINEVQDEIDAEVVRATAAETQIRTDINAGRYSVTTTVAALVHNIVHNLNTADFLFNVMVDDGTGVFRNDIVPVEIVNANEIKIELSESRNIKVNVMSMSAL